MSSSTISDTPTTIPTTPTLAQQASIAPPEAGIAAIRKRSLARPLSFYHGEGTKQKNITGVRRVVESLITLCEGYNTKSVEEQAAIRCKAYSQLAFYLAYQDPDLFADQAGNLKFPFPTEDGTVAYYTLDQTIDFGGGLKAFGFRGNPGDPPLLIFHGTHMKPSSSGMGRTVLADVDPFGVGRTHYALNESAIADWLKKATNHGQGSKAIVCGHSLGGSFATYAGVHLHQYVQKVRAFNTPTIDSSTYHAYDLLGEKPDIQTYNNKGDLLSDCGHGFRVGSHYTVTSERHDPEADEHAGYFKGLWKGVVALYNGSHTISLFEKSGRCRVVALDVNATNQEADGWLSKPGRYLRGLLKCIAALPVIAAVAAKKFAFGCRSWDACKFGLAGLLLEGLKTTLKIGCPLYWVYALHKYCTSENSELSLIYFNKINHFIKNKATDYENRNKETDTRPLEQYIHEEAWEAFTRKELSFKEFSSIYLRLVLNQDLIPERVRTQPLKVSLMIQVVLNTLKTTDLQQHASNFCTSVQEDPKQLLHYLYNEEDLVKDLQSYLSKTTQVDGAFRAKMLECARHVKAIKEFEIFRGEEHWSHRQTRTNVSDYNLQNALYVQPH